MPCFDKNLYDSNMEIHNGIYLSPGLFGESSQLPDVVHCETIAARSALHDWELAPHRHGHLHQVLLLTSGSGVAYLEGESHAIGAMQLVNVAPGEVHAFQFEPGTQGYVVTLATEMLDQWLAGFAEARRAIGRSFSGAFDAETQRLAENIWHEFNGLGSARALVLRGLCTTLLGLVARVSQALGLASDAKDDTPELFRRFEALIEQHYLAHWGVADYARRLAVSPTHLSRVVRASTGQPASQLIEARVLREARRLLVYTHLRVASIADSLGFADPAYFSRHFTRACGLSPRAFRQQLGKGA